MGVAYIILSTLALPDNPNMGWYILDPDSVDVIRLLGQIWPLNLPYIENEMFH